MILLRDVFFSFFVVGHFAVILFVFFFSLSSCLSVGYGPYNTVRIQNAKGGVVNRWLILIKPLNHLIKRLFICMHASLYLNQFIFSIKIEVTNSFNVWFFFKKVDFSYKVMFHLFLNKFSWLTMYITSYYSLA